MNKKLLVGVVLMALATLAVADGTLKTIAGDILLAPAGGTVQVGNESSPSDLAVTGDLRLNGGHRYIKTSDDLYWQPDKTGRTFNIKDTNGADKFYVYANNGKTYVAGNLGVGTTSPGQKLSVNGDISTSKLYYTTAGTDEYALHYAGGSTLLTGRTKIAVIGDSNNNDAGTSPIFSVMYGGPTTDSATERLTVLRNGNVGVGTSSPDAKLDVDGGNIRVGGTGEGLDLDRSNGGGYIRWMDGSGSSYWTLQRNSGGDNQLRLHANDRSNQKFIVSKAYNSGETLVVDTQSTRVGIGTNNPSSKLHVYDSAHVSANIEANGNYESSLYLKNSLSRWGIIVNDDWSGPLQFYRTAGAAGSSGYMMTLDKDGRVGIGTTTPETTLDINGNIKVSELGGRGNAYACIDSSGKLYRSNQPCT